MAGQSQTPPAVMIMNLIPADGGTKPGTGADRLTIAWARRYLAARLVPGGTGLTDGFTGPLP
jgi:hypothetical protein